MFVPTPALIDRLPVLEARQGLIRDLLLVLAGSGLIALSAKVQVALLVPITLQSLVILVLAASYGFRLASLTLIAYLAQGAAGLPVFAGTPEKGLGLAYMMGPTGGYLIGFVAAAALVGFLAERGFVRDLPRALVTMALGHGAMFLFGFLWLAALIGAEAAFAGGIAPFYAATAIKTALAAALLSAAHRWLSR